MIIEKNNVLGDGIGSVALLDVMGSDRDIEAAARVSYRGKPRGDGETRRLIRYLMSHRHTSPFEMGEIKFHVKAPIFVARQWLRHRTASPNEISGRYTEMSDEFFFFCADEICVQSGSNKQGRGESTVSDPYNAECDMRDAIGAASSAYADLLANGVSREQARIVLPLSTYTEWIWKIDLHNLLHFLKLRTDEHAQLEIRKYADAICEMVAPHFPITFEAWEDYVREAKIFSRMEMALMREIANRVVLDGLDPLSTCETYGLTRREFEDFKKKLK